MMEASKEVQELAHSVFSLNGRLILTGNRLVAPLGLTSAWWQVLGALHYSTVPLPSAAIARNMGLSRQGVQRVLDLLEVNGLIEFQENPHHRRAKLAALTSKGRKAAEAADRASAPINQTILKTVGSRRLREVTETLNQIAALLTHQLQNAGVGRTSRNAKNKEKL